VLRAGLLHHPLDPAAQAHDPVDDPLDLEIEVGSSSRIDSRKSSTWSRSTDLAIARLFHDKSLDVKRHD
jgi:hypothetical protein